MSETSDQLAFEFLQGFKPLLERFGHDFFKSVPVSPGVYVMRDATGRILYAGQSENLKKRLAYYKNIQHGREPRRMIQLASQTRSLSWELCASPVEAQIRENQLLREYRPRFNVANTLAVTYCFVVWEFNQDAAICQITDAPPSEATHVFGAFKARALVRSALAALSRLLWIAQHRPPSAYHLPSKLLRNKIPDTFGCALPSQDWRDLVLRFYAGESRDLAEQIRSALPTLADPFLNKLIAADLETLASFAEHGPERHRAMRHSLGLHEKLIRKDELDDLLVLFRSGRNLPPPSPPRQEMPGDPF